MSTQPVPGAQDRTAQDDPAAAVPVAAQGPDLVRLLLIASVALITLVAFENLAVAAAMPAVTEDLGGLRLYALASGAPLATQLIATALSGAWTDARGARGSLLTGVVLFCGGLAIAGLAPTMEVLVVGRAVQGFGGGLLIVPLYVLVGAMVPAERQPSFFAAFSAAWVVPALVGPGVAGLVVEVASWRWIFLGVPVLMLAAAVVLVPLLRHLPGPAADARPQPRRVLVAAGGTGIAVAALQVSGAASGAWALPLAVAAVIALVLSLPVVLPAGTVVLRRGVPAAVACRSLLNATFMTAQTFLPLLLVREHGWLEAQAGLVLTASAITWALGAAIQGRVRSEGGRARLSWSGPLVLTAGTIIAAGATLPGRPWFALVGWTVAGLGIGLVFPAMSVLVLQQTPKAQHGQVSSALQVADAFGAALGLAGGGALFTALVGDGGTTAYLAGLTLAALFGLLAALAGSRAARRPVTR